MYGNLREFLLFRFIFPNIFSFLLPKCFRLLFISKLDTESNEISFDDNWAVVMYWYIYGLDYYACACGYMYEVFDNQLWC